MELAKTEWTAQPGELIRLTGTITNSSENRMRVFGYGWYAPTGFVESVTALPIFTYLEAGETYSGDLFDLVVQGDASYETHPIRFDVGATDLVREEDIYASAHASVSVVPEPPVWAAALIAPAFLLRRKRRDRATLA